MATKDDIPINIMMTRFSPLLFRSVSWMVCMVLLLSIPQFSHAEYLGPVFPGEHTSDLGLNEPLPLPKRNPLLQRANISKQVVFDDLDPVGSIISQDIFEVDEFDVQSARGNQMNRVPSRAPLLPNEHSIFVDGSTYIQGGIWQSDMGFEGEMGDPCHMAMGGYYAGPIYWSFGMGLFDNLTFFAESTAFKTELNNGMGSFGAAQGLNWSTPVTPHGTVTAQYGLRAVQGDVFSRTSRQQTFMTAGIFKRFASLQGGVAVDWLQDRSALGEVKVRQMRCELSIHTFRNCEVGFISGFDVFRDDPTTYRIDSVAALRGLGGSGGMVDVHDYYLLFFRRHLACGGQVELRCGATERGDWLMNVLGEVAISDRLAVNGGISMMTPSEGRSLAGNYRESWSMSLGVVLYLRGGATSRQANMYRPMFDVAGNNSFFTRIAAAKMR